MRKNPLLIFSVIVLIVAALLILFPSTKTKVVKPLVYRALMKYENHQEQSDHLKTRWDLFARLDSSDKDVLLLGDSIIEGGEWEEIFAKLQEHNREVEPIVVGIKNRGVSGQNLRGLVEQTGVIKSWQFKKLFFLIGINDVINGDSFTSIKTNYEKMFGDLLKDIPGEKLYVISLLPSFRPDLVKRQDLVDNLNAFLKTYSSEHKMHYLDANAQFVDENNLLSHSFSYDGLHLNGTGYFKLAEILYSDVNSR